jgi:RNA polymerase sigma factor (sigma-70 family)
VADQGVATTEARFEELVRAHARIVRAAIARTAGTSGMALAEDIEQRVYLALWKQVADQREIHHPASYLYRAAVRETLALVREEQRRRLDAEPRDETQPSEARSPEATPVERLASRELGRRIDQAIAALAPERRRAVRAHLAGLAVQDLMTIERWSYQKARNLVQRGMAELRQRLVARGIDG